MADSKDLAKKQLTPIQDLARQLNDRAMLKQIQTALPRGLTADKFVRTVITAAQRTPKLLQCTPLSVTGSVMEAAQLGLELDPALGQAYLVPLGEGKGSERVLKCQMWPGYRGYIALAMRTGVVAGMFGCVVRKDDEFDIIMGTDHQMHHKVKYPESMDPNDWIGAYSVITYTKHNRPDFEFMGRDEILRIKKNSPSMKANAGGPWVTHEDRQWIKTTIRRLSKRIELSTNDHRLQKAAALEDYHEAGVEKIGLGVDDYALLEAEGIDVTEGATRRSEEEKENGSKGSQGGTLFDGGATGATNGGDQRGGSKSTQPKAKGKAISKAECDAVFALATDICPKFDDMTTWVKRACKHFGVDKPQEITVDQYAAFMGVIKNGVPPAR